ncbi:WxcM-like domain-containing protein [Patescibacteria group bacterium]|nr:WxcM-like domain-containing protein [Patescibacteria group bacterium]
MEENKPDFIKVFNFSDDLSKPGRNLSSVKIGDLYMTRMIIEPGVTTGNYYHKDTRQMFYVESGQIYAKFEHVDSKEKKELNLVPARHVVHVPERTASATKNVGKGTAVLVFFSDKLLRSEDNFDYKIL